MEPAEHTVSEEGINTPAEDVLTNQGLEEVSEEDLMGVSEQTEEESASSESSSKETEQKEVEDDKSDDDKSDDDKSDDDKSEDDKSEDDDKSKDDESKPPKGYVPLKAVRDARAENARLRDQLKDLSTKVDELSTKATPKEPGKFDAFKELSDEEFKVLASDEPAEALAYMKTLSEFREHQRNEVEEQHSAERHEQYKAQVFERASQQMEEAVPGLFDDDDVASEFRSFAEELGFGEDLFFLTNPATQVTLPGDSKPQMLGELAADIVKSLANAKAKSAAVKPSKSDVDVEKLKADIRKEVETEFLAKVKKGEPFRSLATVPSSTEDRPEFSGKILSEAEFMKLSSKEQELYLAGS